MAKRQVKLTLSRLRLLDEACRESNVREIEMMVDGIVDVLPHPGYCAQYFTDAGLYGFDEANRYLTKAVDPAGKLVKADELSKLRAKIAALTLRVQ